MIMAVSSSRCLIYKLSVIISMQICERTQHNRIHNSLESSLLDTGGLFTNTETGSKTFLKLSITKNLLSTES